MEDLKQHARTSETLMVSCLSSDQLQDVVQMACRLIYYRHCFPTSESVGKSKDAAVGSSRNDTHAEEKQQVNILGHNVSHCTPITEPGVCSYCDKIGEQKKPSASVWCPTCRHSLCEDSVAEHEQFYREHIKQSLSKLRSLKEVELLTSPLCQEKTSVDSEKASADYYGKLVAIIISMESQWLRTATVLEERHVVQGDLEATRNHHLHQLQQRKRRIVDSIDVAYQQIELLTRNAYLDMEGNGDVASAVAGYAKFDILEAQNYVRLLDESANNCKIPDQQSKLRERLMVLSAELDTLSIHVGTAIKDNDIDVSMPDDLRNVLNNLTKIPLPLPALSCPPDVTPQQKPRLSFSTPPATIQLGVRSSKFALLNEKSILLSNFYHGMTEVWSENGRKFSRWLPPVYDVDKCVESSCEDAVVSVVALSDGRAAVGLGHKGVVVILRRCKKSRFDIDRFKEPENVAWTECRRLDPLYYSPHFLSAQGDVLAACSLQSTEVQLMSICSGRRLGPKMISDYEIGSLAVSSNAVITGSCNKLELGDGSLACVIDAHSITNHDLRLWHHELNIGEELKDLYADSLGGCLYAAIWMSDRCSGRVAALSLTDGSELLHVVLGLDANTHSALLPSALSVWNDAVTEQQMALQQQSGTTINRPMLLAVLYSDAARKLKSTVILYHSSSSN